MKNRMSIAKGLKYTSLVSVSLISILIFVFALVSGSAAYGVGLAAIIRNIPNATPWIGLILITIISWRNSLAGGICITIFGIAAVYFFNFSGANFFLSTFVLTCSTVVLGLMLLASYFLKPRKFQKH
ncbi:MAG: hypothetical protein JXQ87_11410 [Bacteroidia bacterium]